MKNTCSNEKTLGIALRKYRMERYRLISCYDCEEDIRPINECLNWRLRIYKAYKRLISDYDLDSSQYDFTHMVGYNGNDFERNHISLQVTATKKP